jgi:hypothetical protein
MVRLCYSPCEAHSTVCTAATTKTLTYNSMLCLWHAEMAGLNGMVRTLVRMLYGATLMSGSYQQALLHFRTASELAPHMLIHRVEYGE